MDLPAFDHNLHQSDTTHTLHTHADSSLDLHDHQDLLSDPNLGVHHDPFVPSNISIYEPHHIHNAFEHQGLADYQPHHANGLLDHQYSQVDHPSHFAQGFENQHLADYHPHHANSFPDHQYSHADHTSHWDHLSQRSGSETASELLSKANELEKKANDSLSSSQSHSKTADYFREHHDESGAASHDRDAKDKMAESEKHRAEAEKAREQAKKV
ncbi:MAG: hypothetical protein ACKO8H_02785 [Microcystis panniformis]